MYIIAVVIQMILQYLLYLRWHMSSFQVGDELIILRFLVTSVLV